MTFQPSANMIGMTGVIIGKTKKIFLLIGRSLVESWDHLLEKPLRWHNGCLKPMVTLCLGVLSDP